MANANPTTSVHSVHPICELHQSLNIGEVVAIPVERLDAACLLVRAIVAMDDVDDTDVMLREGESYEVLARRLRHLKANLHEVADQARALIGTS